MGFNQVAQLMGNYIVCKANWKLKESPVEKNPPVLAAGTPAVTQVADFDPRWDSANSSGKQFHASLDPLPSDRDIPEPEMIFGGSSRVGSQNETPAIESQRLFLNCHDSPTID